MRASARGLFRLWVAFPLVLFSGMAALFVARLGAGTAPSIPSILIGRPAPQFVLNPLDGLVTPGPPGLSTADLKSGHVTIVNVFASWCAECQQEHEALMALSTDLASQRPGVELAGIIYKDDPTRVLAYLTTRGNPFVQVGNDRSGRTGIDFGVYGVPETFVVRGDGTIAYKLVGGLSDATRPALLSAIAKAQLP